MTAVDDTPRAADTRLVNGPASGGAYRVGAGYRAIDDKVTLFHGREMLAMPREAAIALRDALSLAIAIPDRARAMAATPDPAGG